MLLPRPEPFLDLKPLPFPALRRGLRRLAGLLGLMVSVLSLLAAPDISRLPAAVTRPVDFQREIRPIFERACFSCHGPDKQKSGLRLDLKAAALAGGEHGVAIIPGRSAESPLIHNVAGLVPDRQMPAKGEPLTGDELALLRGWIDQGAAWPAEADTAKVENKADHWAFQPNPHPVPPAVEASAWVRNDLDRFILARLERDGFTPSPEADRRTLIRRLYFDLLGLPPEPEVVTRFVNDPDPLAFERLVDQLLASPHYGERWARHWLDVVHFGESHGYDKDKPRDHAWPYRDYVIRSLNADKPYSRFVQEQLAGDVLFPDDPDGVVALGFIAAGPWDFVGHVELPESKTDGLIARYNDRDDMVMTTMSTFLSLTVHCARCHDHKFDPIPQRDYYALQAVFAGVDRADRAFDPDPARHRERLKLQQSKRELTARKRAFDQRLASLTSPEVEALDRTVTARKQELESLPDAKSGSPSNGYHSDIAAQPDVEKWVQVDLGEVRPLTEVRLIPARPTDFADTPGFGFPRRFRVEAADDAGFQHPRVLADHTAQDFANPGDKPFVLATPDLRARFLRVTATRLWERTSDFVFALAELQAYAGGENVARARPVTALDSIESGRWGRTRLVDGFSSRDRLEGDQEQARFAQRRQELKSELEALSAQRTQLRLGLLPAESRTELQEVTRRLQELDARLAALPAPEMVYAATAEFASQGSFHAAIQPRPVHFLRRGDVKAKGDLMTPASLTCFPWLPGGFSVREDAPESARRAELARWLTHPKNDLLRRSIVNRTWHYHFGRGLVETPNDFGWMGAAPSHPELLDWLAGWFHENGESLKSLHRLLVTSATWRQTSRVAPGSPAARQDSDNRLLWRMNRNRLDAESLRDAMLAVSGRLDPKLGGPSARQFWFKDDHSPTYDYTRLDPDDPANFRRSIYRFIVRSVPDPFMDTLDCPDANVLTARRNQTLTPLQALALLNNPFVLRQAEQFAARLQTEEAAPADQIRRACELAFGRAPTVPEAGKLGAYAAQHGLANACRLLFNSSEFTFVD